MQEKEGKFKVKKYYFDISRIQVSFGVALTVVLILFTSLANASDESATDEFNESICCIKNGSFELGLQSWTQKAIFQNIVYAWTQKIISWGTFLNKWVNRMDIVKADELSLDTRIDSTFNETFDLDLRYLKEPITIQYREDLRNGKYYKSVIRFDFYDKNYKYVSQLSYAMSGEQDWSANQNMTSAEGIPYVTLVKNDFKLGEFTIFKIDNLLDIYNEKVVKLSPPGKPLVPEQISRVRVNLNAWSGGGGDISRTTYRGWGKYVRTQAFSQIVNKENPEANYLPMNGGAYLELDVDRTIKTNSLEQKIRLRPGKKYFIMGHAKVDLSPLTPRIEIADVLTGKTLSAFEAPGYLAQAGWTTLGGFFSTPKGEVLIRIVARISDLPEVYGDDRNPIPKGLVNESSMKKWRYYYDDIKIYEVPEEENDFRMELEKKLGVKNFKENQIVSHLVVKTQDQWRKSKFVEHNMGSVSIPIPLDSLRCQETNSRPIFSDQGYESAKSIGLTAGEEEPSRCSFKISIPKHLQKPNVNFSVHAWVWAEASLSASLKIESETGKKTESAFHPGGKRWVHLTVVHPFSEIVRELTVSVVNGYGKARFDKISALALEDDRFDRIQDMPQRLRESVNYRKNDRIRIVVMGHSNVYAVGVPKNATFSYILQSKLESLYPGRFEVFNYGIDEGNLREQLIAMEDHFFLIRGLSNDMHNYAFNAKPLRWVGDDEDIYRNTQENALSVKALEPDVVLIASMWNEVSKDCFSSYSQMGSIGEEMAYIAYHRAFIDFLDNPSQETYSQADAIYRQAVRSGKGAKVPCSPYDSPEAYNELFHRTKDSWEFMVTALAKKALKWSNVWFAAFPNRIDPKIIENWDKMGEMAMTLQPGWVSKVGIFTWNQWGDAQEQAYANAGKSLDIPFANLRHQYIDEFQEIVLKKRIPAMRSYFMDEVHFSARGNQFLADRFYSTMESYFKQMGHKVPAN